MNDIIIYEFQKLINLVQNNLDKQKKSENIFRLKSLKTVLNIIKKYPKKITLDNLKELEKFQGIGQGSIKRIKEILISGKLDETKDFKENTKLLDELELIVGVGHTTAIEFIKNGVKSINDLKKKIKNKEIKVNDKIKLGIKYYGKFFGNIPRNEITKIKLLIDKIINKLNKNLSDENKYIYEICGSYRREKLTSGDIDVLISKLGVNNQPLEYFIQKLKQPMSSNNNQPLIVDDITYKHYETKYMGFLKYKNSLIRRIDIRYVPYKYYYSALLYFTGPAEFNVKLRKIAKVMGYKLSEYGLKKISDGNMIKITSEKDIFDFLKLEYIEPKNR
jgi:DNA polymerase beta